MAAKECPMCGETMRLREREVTDRVPGHAADQDHEIP